VVPKVIHAARVILVMETDDEGQVVIIQTAQEGILEQVHVRGQEVVPKVIPVVKVIPAMVMDVEDQVVIIQKE